MNGVCESVAECVGAFSDLSVAAGTLGGGGGVEWTSRGEEENQITNTFLFFAGVFPLPRMVMFLTLDCWSSMVS